MQSDKKDQEPKEQRNKLKNKKTNLRGIREGQWILSKVRHMQSIKMSNNGEVASNGFACTKFCGNGSGALSHRRQNGFPSSHLNINRINPQRDIQLIIIVYSRYSANLNISKLGYVRTVNEVHIELRFECTKQLPFIEKSL